MPSEVNAIDLALAVRQGQLRLKDVPVEHRQVVASVARSLTDAQMQTILIGRERNRTRECNARVKG